MAIFAQLYYYYYSECQSFKRLKPWEGFCLVFVVAQINDVKSISSRSSLTAIFVQLYYYYYYYYSKSQSFKRVKPWEGFCLVFVVAQINDVKSICSRSSLTAIFAQLYYYYSKSQSFKRVNPWEGFCFVVVVAQIKDVKSFFFLWPA